MPLTSPDVHNQHLVDTGSGPQESQLLQDSCSQSVGNDDEDDINLFNLYSRHQESEKVKIQPLRETQLIQLRTPEGPKQHAMIEGSSTIAKVEAPTSDPNNAKNQNSSAKLVSHFRLSEMSEEDD